MKKIVFTTVLFLVPMVCVWANNQKAIEYFTYGLNKTAKQIFNENLAGGSLSAAEKAEAYYYLGQISFSEQQKDSAMYYYKEGQKTAPDYIYNVIGQVKVMLGTNREEAEKLIKDVVLDGKNKKSPDILCAVADAYLDNNITDMAEEFIAKAKDADSKAAAPFLVEGDLYAAKKDYGKACGLYEQAIYFDNANKEAHIKYARMYAGINFDLAMEMLQKLIQTDANSFLPYREIGDICYDKGQFDKAAEAYGKYIENDAYSFENYPKYASILFHNKNYDKAASIIEAGLQKDPANPVLNRVLMYNLCEQKKYPEGMAVADKFMQSGADPIALDHIYYAKLLAKNNRVDDAIQQYGKALNLDPGKTSVYKDMADAYEDGGQYEKAAGSYASFIEKGGNQVKLADHFTLGKAYYSAASDTTALSTADSTLFKEKRIQFCQKADSAFAYVAEKAPDSYLGNFWRARTNAILDPETEQGLAKPYYEAAAETLLKKNNDKDKALLVECYSYLGYYYYLQQKIDDSKQYWAKILELDPENKIATEAMKGM